MSVGLGINAQLLATVEHTVVGELVDDVYVLIGHVAVQVPALEVDALRAAQILEYDVLAVERRLQYADGARHIAVGFVFDRVLVVVVVVVRWSFSAASQVDHHLFAIGGRRRRRRL